MIVDNEISETADQELQSYIYQVEVATAIEEGLRDMSEEMLESALRDGAKQVANECYEVVIFEQAMLQYLEEFVETLTHEDLRTDTDHQLNDEAEAACADD